MRYLMLSLTCSLFLTLAPASAYYPGDAGAVVRNWYIRYLNRNPDPQGWNQWANALNRGMAPQDVLAKLLGSDEYYEKAGGTPGGFVETIFQDLLGRWPTRGEMNYWAGREVQDGREAVAKEILDRYPQAGRALRAAPPPPPNPYAWPNGYGR